MEQANPYQPLLDALAMVEHSGDYGELYYLPAKKECWVVFGDADEFDEEEIIARLISIDLCDSVMIEAEVGPPEDQGWVLVGKFGIETA